MKTPKKPEHSRKCTDCDHYEACRMRAGYNFLHEADADRCAIYAEPSLFTKMRRMAETINNSLEEDVVRAEMKVKQLEARLVEANKTSEDLMAKLAEYEKPLEPLPEEQIYNDPVWLEMRAEGVALMIADIVPSFDEPGSKAEIMLLGNARRAHLPYAHYGSSWRCWSRRPTDAERKAAKWDE